MVPSGQSSSSLESIDWEKHIALECINELRLDRFTKPSKESKHSNIIKCKICKDKTFCSSNSLIIHYRHHAGIKSFECTFCNATFTRQHSLNYHLSVHYNKTRFVCEECGRNFRHPSHFKEHRRRHTGETPFQCSECSVKLVYIIIIIYI